MQFYYKLRCPIALKGNVIFKAPGERKTYASDPETDLKKMEQQQLIKSVLTVVNRE